MKIKICANAKAGETEKRFNGVTAAVIGDYEKQMANRETPFIFVLPDLRLCQMVREIYVRKDCIG